MKHLSQTTQFARDVGRMRRRRKSLEKLKEAVAVLARGGALDPKHRDHALIGPWRNCRACHLESDWVLIYSMDARSLRLERTGTHSDLFKK
jgi:mRNA interferase YafQ